MYGQTGQQRPIGSYPSQSQSNGRPNTNALANNGSSNYGTASRRNVGFQPIMTNTPSDQNNVNSSSMNENTNQDLTPRAPFYPAFGTSFGSNNHIGGSNITIANHTIHSQRHQHPQQSQQQQNHPSMGFATPISSKGMNNTFINQYPIQSTSDVSRMQEMSGSNGDHEEQGFNIHHHQQQQQQPDQNQHRHHHHHHHQQQQQQQQQQNAYPPFAASNSVGQDSGSDSNSLQHTAALQQLNRHMAKLAGNVATSVSQNELVISLLERLVSLTENLASPVHRQHYVNSTNHHHHPHPHPSSSISPTSEVIISQHAPNSLQFTSPNVVEQDRSQRQNEEVFQNEGMPSQSSKGPPPPSASSQHPLSSPVLSRETSRSDLNEDHSNVVSITYSQPPSEPYVRKQNDHLSRSVRIDEDRDAQHVSQGQESTHMEQSQGENRNPSSNQMLHVPTLNESFDDPLNFIGTPASTTFHQNDGQSERGFLQQDQQQQQQQQQIRQGKSIPIIQQIRPSNTDNSDLSSAATPHSGPPRYDTGDSIGNMDDHINRIPSPVFSESIPSADVHEEFPSFDLSMNVIPRRESRRISIRAQQQRQSLSSQYQAQADQQAKQREEHQQQRKTSEGEAQQDAAQVERELQSQESEQNRSSIVQPIVDDGDEENEVTSSPIARRRGRKRKAVLPPESLRPAQGTVEEEETADETQEGPDDLWLEWLEPRTPPASRSGHIPQARYRTIKEVRLDRKAKTNRSLATIGRIPLKEYLEVGGDPEYRAVRRMARTVYNNWLEPNVRLAKQAEDRLLACFHRIEYDFPILADCEGHWKARELMLQVIDNAIDEVAFHKRREARLLGKPEKRNGQGIPKKNVTNGKSAPTISRDRAPREDARPATRRKQGRTGKNRRMRNPSDGENEEEGDGEEEGERGEDEGEDEVYQTPSHLAKNDALWSTRSNEQINGQNRDPDGSGSNPVYSHPSHQNQRVNWDAAHDPALLTTSAPSSTADHNADYPYIPARAPFARRGAQAAW